MIKKIITYLAVIAITLQSSMLLGLFNPQKAHAGAAGDPNKILINEFQVSPTGSKFVELYNANDSEVGPVDIGQWSIVDNIGNSKTISDASYPLASGEFYVFTNVTMLNGNTDVITLIDKFSSEIDQVSYGAGPITLNSEGGIEYYNIIKNPGEGTSAGRLSDGAASWYSGLVVSVGSSNSEANPSNWPSQIDSANIKAGSTNPANYINNNSQANVTVEAELANVPDSSITAYINDSEGNVVSNEVEMLPGLHQEVSGIDASSLSEGNVTPWIMTTDSISSISTEYMEGASGTKDTVAPVVTAAQVKAGENNAANVINNFSKTNVNVDVTSEEVITDAYKVEAKLTDTDSTSKEGSTSGSGEKTATVSGIDTTDPLVDGAINVQARLTDKAGNVSDWFTGTAATLDTENPTGGLRINDNATVTNSYNVHLTIASDLALQMKISNSSDLSGAEWEDFAASKEWSLRDEFAQTLIASDHTVYIQFKSADGNISQVYSDSIYLDLNVLDPISTNDFVAGEQTITPTPGLELDLTAFGFGTLTTATYATNPGSNLPSGISGFGKYWEMAVSDQNMVSWPVMIKIYFTKADLAAAGVTDKHQLVGIYYWDNASVSWKLYSQTGVNTDDVTIGGVDYAGYVWANADHFTPITIGADLTNPDKPTGLTATAGNGEVELKWAKVDDATGYYVRYRELTSADNATYNVIFLSGKDTTSTKITNLKNGVQYEFGIASRDSFGNISDYSVIMQTPQASSEVETTTAKSFFVGTAQAAENVAANIPGSSIETIGPENGNIKAEQSGINWARFWVTLSILIIAAGAGFGGYYGYQWWMEKAEVKVEKGKKTKKTGRW